MSETRQTASLALGALGVVFGDIGTSPLYALKACFNEHPRTDPTPENVLGAVSLMFWALILVISVKYAVYVMRADNEGEGGVFSLLALLLRGGVTTKKSAAALAAVFGAALLYADGSITPVISVISAVEGLTVVAPGAGPFVVPLACAILLGLFAVQRRGTATIGRIMGPVMLLWFVAIGLLGARSIAASPAILAAVDPAHAVRFFQTGGLTSFMVLGAVVLCVTGGEALYADMGHFGVGPIRLAWYGLALPSLVCAYFGQGALVLADPSLAAEPFFNLAPDGLRAPLVGLATLAAVIASQAVISGVFSLTRQAVQLGFLPFARILHTSPEVEGQIYAPKVNVLMLLACLALTLHFQTSSRLAGAYGIAVTNTMLITSVLFYLTARRLWGWGLLRAGLPTLAFLVVDLAFFGANLFKLGSGGWVPMVAAGAITGVMRVWSAGREDMRRRLEGDRPGLDAFFADLKNNPPLRAPGTVVFLSSSLDMVPLSLLNCLRRFKTLQETVVVATIVVENEPKIPSERRLNVRVIAPGAYHVIGRYGYMELPNAPLLLRQAENLDPRIRTGDAFYVLGRAVPVPAETSALGRFSRTLFGVMLKHAASPAEFCRIPPDDMVDFGLRVAV